jgi:hypothetical protein
VASRILTAPGAEVSHHSVARILAQVPLQCGDGIAQPLQLPTQLLDAVLGAPEDDRGTIAARIKQLLQDIELGAIGYVVDDMLDLRHILGPRVDLHRQRIGQMPTRRLMDPGRHGGREEGGLPRPRHMGQDPLDIGREAAIEHLIGLVEDEIAHLIELQRAAADQVEDATGRADDDLRAGAHRRLLRPERTAAIDQHGTQAAPLAEFIEDTADLRGEFARRGQDERLHRPDARIDPLDQRDGEGERFAGTGAGLTDDVATGEEWREGERLDGGRCLDSHRRERGARGGGQRQF